MAVSSSDGDLTHLTLVLTMQRSGSTLLGRDIESLGGLGSPREHFTGLAEQVRRGGRADEAELLDRLQRGRDRVSPLVTAVKLHVHQAWVVSEIIEGNRASTPESAMKSVIEWAQRNFDRVLLLVLVRNSVDAAISRVFAEETGNYVSAASGQRTPLPDIPDLNNRIIAELQTILRWRTALNTVAAAQEDALLLTYEELTTDVDTTIASLVEHARGRGFEPRSEKVKRTLEKLIGSEQSQKMREAFLDYLRTEPGR